MGRWVLRRMLPDNSLVSAMGDTYFKEIADTGTWNAGVWLAAGN